MASSAGFSSIIESSAGFSSIIASSGFSIASGAVPPQAASTKTSNNITCNTIFFFFIRFSPCLNSPHDTGPLLQNGCKIITKV